MLAIVSAMPEEISLVIDTLTNVTAQEFGRRQFYVGSLFDVETVVVFGRLGKVAAAATVTQLITSFPVDELIFSGVAGGVAHGLKVGDVVVGTDLIQHDMDASPIFPRYEIPLLGQSYFGADPTISERLMTATDSFLAEDLTMAVETTELAAFQIDQPKAVRGVIASGDKFFASHAEVAGLRERLPNVACVEMEGAAVAQVCSEYSIPFGVVRTISDSADDNAVNDFPRFSRNIARHYSLGILARYIQEL